MAVSKILLQTLLCLHLGKHLLSGQHYPYFLHQCKLAPTTFNFLIPLLGNVCTFSCYFRLPNEVLPLNKF